MLIAHQNATRESALNLAVEQTLMETLPPDAELFMLWCDAPSVIVGRNQNARREIRADAEVPVIRRLSGGGAVYHDEGNLCFTFITQNDGRFGDHAAFIAPVVAALNRMGVPAEASGRNDIAAEGRKISGNAQYALGNRLCHHGTLLFDADLAALSGILTPDAEKIQGKGIASVAARVANLKHYLPGMTTDTFAEALLADIALHAPDTQRFAIPADIYRRAEALADARYRTWAWNWGASPPYTYRNATRFEGGGVELLLDVRGGIIESAQIYGDFLALRDLSPLTQALVGCRHQCEDITRAIQNIDTAGLLGSITPKALISLF